MQEEANGWTESAIDAQEIWRIKDCFFNTRSRALQKGKKRAKPLTVTLRDLLMLLIKDSLLTSFNPKKSNDEYYKLWQKTHKKNLRKAISLLRKSFGGTRHEYIVTDSWYYLTTTPEATP